MQKLAPVLGGPLLGTLVFAACSVTTTPEPLGGGTSPGPTSSGTTSPPGSDAGPSGPKDSGGPGADANPGVDSSPVVDHTPVLTYTLNGQPQTVDGSITVTKDASGIHMKAVYPAIYPRTPPLDPGNSWLSITVVDKTSAVCSNKNYVTVLYQETDSTITDVNATGIEGDCTMSITRLGDDGLFEGQATGTLVNTNFNRSWPFTVTWRQAVP